MKITLKIFTLLCSVLITSNGYSMNQVFNNNNNMMVNNINNKENNDQRKMKQAMINIVNDPFRQHAGLQNIGATCYMNATIQAIASNPKFCFYLLKNAYENYNNLLQNNKEGWLTIQFANVIAELWSNTTWYAPYAFKKILGMVNPLFLGVAANDSKDLLLCFYENMHSALNTPTNNAIIQGNNNYINFCNEYFSKNQSLILDQFYFIQSSHMVCNECKFDIDNYNTYNMLISPLEKVRLMKANNNDTTPVTIMDCFKLNENQETFVGENQIYCNNCRQMADATTYNKLDYSPNILSIILNRGKGLQYDVDVNIEEKLDLSDYVTKFKDDSKYFLSAIVCHLGNSGMDGHFVTISRPSPDKPWVLYNDATVTEYKEEYKAKTNINEILQGKKPYILFYTKNKHDANSILNEQQHYFNKINNMKIKNVMPRNMMIMPGMWNNMNMVNNMNMNNMGNNMMWNNMNMMNNMNRNMMLNNMNMNMGMNMVNNNMQKFNNFNNQNMNNFNNNNMVKGMNMHNNIAMNNNFNMNNNMQQNNFHQNMMRNNMN